MQYNCILSFSGYKLQQSNEFAIAFLYNGGHSDGDAVVFYKGLISTPANRVLNLKSEGKSFEEILAAKPITVLLENSWIPESHFIDLA